MSKQKEFTLPSRLESVEQAATNAAEFARGLGFDDDFIYAIDLAVRESVANAVKHGNKFDKTKLVEIRFAGNGGAFEISVRDHGTGFSPNDVPDPTDAKNLLKVNGRGILFMHTFMDEVEWENHEEGGMVVKMRKKL